MQRNVISEIKNLNNCMVKKLFTLGKKEDEKFHPRPLQVEIITYLIENKDKTIYQKDIEEKLKISKEAVSEEINSKEGRGIITTEADACDARRKRIIISKKAIETHDVMMQRLDSLNDSILDGISEDELNIFYKVIEKLKENMKKEGV